MDSLNQHSVFGIHIPGRTNPALKPHRPIIIPSCSEPPKPLLYPLPLAQNRRTKQEHFIVGFERSGSNYFLIAENQEKLVASENTSNTILRYVICGNSIMDECCVLALNEEKGTLLLGSEQYERFFCEVPIDSLSEKQKKDLKNPCNMLGDLHEVAKDIFQARRSHLLHGTPEELTDEDRLNLLFYLQVIGLGADEYPGQGPLILGSAADSLLQSIGDDSGQGNDNLLKRFYNMFDPEVILDDSPSQSFSMGFVPRIQLTGQKTPLFHGVESSILEAYRVVHRDSITALKDMLIETSELTKQRIDQIALMPNPLERERANLELNDELGVETLEKVMPHRNKEAFLLLKEPGLLPMQKIDTALFRISPNLKHGYTYNGGSKKWELDLNELTYQCCNTVADVCPWVVMEKDGFSPPENPFNEDFVSELYTSQEPRFTFYILNNRAAIDFMQKKCGTSGRWK